MSPTSIFDAIKPEAEALLGHPLGRRRTDDKLAYAVMRTLGRSRRTRLPVLKPSYTESLSVGLVRQQSRAAETPLRSLFRRWHRRWRLLRLEQLDQGNTPECVAFTQEHWKRSRPIHTLNARSPHEMYQMAKQRDGYPNEEGTDAHAMLSVCQELGMVESFWWWTGSQDNSAAIDWITEMGPLWFGAYWAESMFRTDPFGLIDVTGTLQYGHETLVVGWQQNYRGMGPAFEICNSWGIDNWGLKGRGWITQSDFFDKLMADAGDLVGVVEKKAA
jgi:hypothetical protein